MINSIYIAWDDARDTGIPIIDEQHRGINAAINTLYYFIQAGWALESLGPTLNVMRQYCGFHFKTEEMLLAELHYPGLEDELRAHRRFFDAFNQVAIEARHFEDPGLFLRFIRDWWLAHLGEHHAEYRRYVELGLH